MKIKLRFRNPKLQALITKERDIVERKLVEVLKGSVDDESALLNKETYGLSAEMLKSFEVARPKIEALTNRLMVIDRMAARPSEELRLVITVASFLVSLIAIALAIWWHK